MLRRVAQEMDDDPSATGARPLNSSGNQHEFLMILECVRAAIDRFHERVPDLSVSEVLVLLPT